MINDMDKIKTPRREAFLRLGEIRAQNIESGVSGDFAGISLDLFEVGRDKLEVDSNVITTV